MKIKCDSGCDYVTADKEYTVIKEHYINEGKSFYDILCDTGNRITVIDKDCPHTGGNWIRVKGQRVNNMLHSADQHSAMSIVSKAMEHMNERATTYDNENGERSIGATVEAFNAITDGKMDTEEKGWLFMLLLKCVRSQQGKFKLDNYEDGSAYFGLMGESAYKERGGE